MFNKGYVAKLGLSMIRPNWRFDALTNPTRYKLDKLTSIPTSNANCLKRFLTLGLDYEVQFTIPQWLRSYVDNTDPEQAEVLTELYLRSIKNERKINIGTNIKIFQKVPVWNIGLSKKIEDEYLRRLILHVSNFQNDEDIKYALKLANSSEHTEIFKTIGYYIYAGMPDAEIGKRWQIPLNHVKAIRHLFYDFSGFPKDRIANITYLRQLANIDAISEIDFAYYKRAFDLGELGLNAQADFYKLNAEERNTIAEYLSKSMPATAFNLNFSIKTQQDAVIYGTMVSKLSDYYVQQNESNYINAKIRNLDANTRRVEGSLLDEEVDVGKLDNELMNLLTEHSKQNALPEYKPLDSLLKL